MKDFFWFLASVSIGLILAHFVGVHFSPDYVFGFILGGFARSFY